jgi:hypothetical protein
MGSIQQKGDVFGEREKLKKGNLKVPEALKLSAAPVIPGERDREHPAMLCGF